MSLGNFQKIATVQSLGCTNAGSKIDVCQTRGVMVKDSVCMETTNSYVMHLVRHLVYAKGCFLSVRMLASLKCHPFRIKQRA